MDTPFTNGTVTRHGDDVTCIDFTGISTDGDRPQHISDECRAALTTLATSLQKEGLTLHDTRHLAAMLRTGDEFAQCQVAISEALGPARPTLTLRIVHQFPHPDQRIAVSLIASAS